MTYALEQYHIPEDQYDNGNLKGTLLSHKIKAHVRAMPDSRLESLFTDCWGPSGGYNADLPAFEAVLEEVSRPENPVNYSWLVMTLAEEAYSRGILPEEDYLRLQD